MSLTTKDNLLLQQIENNEVVEATLGKKTIYIRRLNNAVAEKFDRYTAEAEISYGEKSVLFNMSNNRILVPKCVSLLILHSWLKVKLFHWIHWRMLHRKYSQQELGDILMEGLSLGELNTYLRNLNGLQQNSRIIQKMTKATIVNILPELRSEAATKSSSNSTEQSPL